MTAEWPPEAREAVARAMHAEYVTMYGSTADGASRLWALLRPPSKQTWLRRADAALAALAPFIAALLAEAKREGLREAAGIAENIAQQNRLLDCAEASKRDCHLISGRIDGASTAAAAIIARAEAPATEAPVMCRCGRVTERECSEAQARIAGCEVPNE